MQTTNCLTLSQGLSTPLLDKKKCGSFHQPNSFSLVVASRHFSMGLSDNTKVLWGRLASWRAAHTLEGPPKDLAKCPNDSI